MDSTNAEGLLEPGNSNKRSDPVDIIGVPVVRRGPTGRRS